ncbi:hypothetical protein KIPB_003309 [Kipferlia bialata]|uniref:Uncharacterized protein n=1 Tax=Kipferlia bialata TaxID=797122 RepID=A0A9K3GGK5_9EUKA|nr:hypothetical protein KIPB_003309 [Kipferlia bialata]|eukprot:g3309.t1
MSSPQLFPALVSAYDTLGNSVSRMVVAKGMLTLLGHVHECPTYPNPHAFADAASMIAECCQLAEGYKSPMSRLDADTTPVTYRRVQLTERVMRDSAGAEGGADRQTGMRARLMEVLSRLSSNSPYADTIKEFKPEFVQILRGD